VQNFANFLLPLTKTFANVSGALRAPHEHVIIAPEELAELTEKIIGCAIEVHRILGPGLLESVYRACMIIELRRQHLHVEVERPVTLDYKGERVPTFRMDLVVNGCVVVEIKSVEQLHPVHSAQVITYLKIGGYPAGLLMNFNATTLKAGLRRLDHPDRYVKRPLTPQKDLLEKEKTS
jgi:GxxExxY protein